MPVNVSESEILFLSSIFLFQIRIVYLHQIPLIIPTLRNNIILLLLRLIMNQSCMFVMLGLTITGTKVITLLVGGYASNVKKEITNFPPPLKRTFCNYQFSARSAVFLWAEGLLMGSKLFIRSPKEGWFCNFFLGEGGVQRPPSIFSTPQQIGLSRENKNLLTFKLFKV